MTGDSDQADVSDVVLSKPSGLRLRVLCRVLDALMTCDIPSEGVSYISDQSSRGVDVKAVLDVGQVQAWKAEFVFEFVQARRLATASRSSSKSRSPSQSPTPSRTPPSASLTPPTVSQSPSLTSSASAVRKPGESAKAASSTGSDYGGIGMYGLLGVVIGTSALCCCCVCVIGYFMFIRRKHKHNLNIAQSDGFTTVITTATEPKSPASRDNVGGRPLFDTGVKTVEKPRSVSPRHRDDKHSQSSSAGSHRHHRHRHRDRKAVETYWEDRGPSPIVSVSEAPVTVEKILQHRSISQQDKIVPVASSKQRGQVVHINANPTEDDVPDAVTLTPNTFGQFVKDSGPATVLEMEDVILNEIARRKRQSDAVSPSLV
jgi:hypothetical protein